MGTITYRGLALVLMLGVGSFAHGQGYPTKPIRLIVPFAAGGTTDVLSRILGQKMGDHFGQQMIVDNRGGAAGSLGATLAARALPDGYTLLLTSLSPVVINVSMYAGKPPYDPEKDLAPVSLITKVPSVLVVHRNHAARNLKDIISTAKANPGKLTYGSSGAGGINHLIGELFRVAVDIDIVHVAYKGAGPASLALLSREIDMVLGSPVAVLPHLRSGQLRALAVSGATRSPALPDVPTISESGVPKFDLTAWYGLMTPGGTPRPVVNRVWTALVDALKAPLVAERLLAEGAAPVHSTPEEFAELIKADLKKWAIAVRISGAKLE